MIPPEMAPIVAAVAALGLAVIGLLAKVIRDSMHNRNGNEPVTSRDLEAHAALETRRNEENRQEVRVVWERIHKLTDDLKVEIDRLRERIHALAQIVNTAAGEPRVLAVRLDSIEHRIELLEGHIEAQAKFIPQVLEALTRLERQGR